MTTPPPFSLHFYRDQITLTRRVGVSLAHYPVDARDLLAALRDLPIASGLLPIGRNDRPLHTLAWRHRQGRASLTAYLPPWQQPLRLLDGRGREYRYTVPLPPTIFQGEERQYRLFALAGPPAGPDTPLYRYPLPDIYDHGGICPGDVTLPVAAADTLETALDALFAARFHTHLLNQRCRRYPDDIRRLLADLDGAAAFPLDELLPAGCTLANLL